MRRLLSSFQSSLEEITIIARPTDDHGLDAVTKALQLQSYNDPSRCEDIRRTTNYAGIQLDVS